MVPPGRGMPAPPGSKLSIACNTYSLVPPGRGMPPMQPPGRGMPPPGNCNSS
jgi:hypothetical protein